MGLSKGGYRATIAIAAGAIVLSVASPARAGFFDRGDQGWFFYREHYPRPPAPLPPPAPSPPPAAAPAKAQKAPPASKAAEVHLTTAWLRANMPKYLAKAIDDPTPANVRLYLYLQKVALDKASTFTDVSQRVVMSDPFLDEESRRPLSSVGAQKADAKAAGEVQKMLRRLASRAGLLWFFRSDCEYCAVEAPTLQALARMYGFRILPISLDGRGLPGMTHFKMDAGQAAALNVTGTPTLFLAGDHRVTMVGEGAVPLVELQRRLLMAGQTAGFLTAQDFAATRPEKTDPPILSSPSVPSDTITNSKDFIKALQRDLGVGGV